MGGLLQGIKIYHIVHADRLPSILADSGLFCDTEIIRTQRPGTNIGLDNDLRDLDKINWSAVDARSWVNRKDDKQAEFLLERCFPWSLVGEIGVCSTRIKEWVSAALLNAKHAPIVRTVPEWYY